MPVLILLISGLILKAVAGQDYFEEHEATRCCHDPAWLLIRCREGLVVIKKAQTDTCPHVYPRGHSEVTNYVAQRCYGKPWCELRLGGRPLLVGLLVVVQYFCVPASRLLPFCGLPDDVIDQKNLTAGFFYSPKYPADTTDGHLSCNKYIRHIPSHEINLRIISQGLRLEHPRSKAMCKGRFTVRNEDYWVNKIHMISYCLGGWHDRDSALRLVFQMVNQIEIKFDKRPNQQVPGLLIYFHVKRFQGLPLPLTRQRERRCVRPTTQIPTSTPSATTSLRVAAGSICISFLRLAASQL